MRANSDRSAGAQRHTIECCAVMSDIYMHASRPELALPYKERILAEQPEHPLASSYLFVLNYDERRPADEIFKRTAIGAAAIRPSSTPATASKTASAPAQIAHRLPLPRLGAPSGRFQHRHLQAHDPNASKCFFTRTGTRKSATTHCRNNSAQVGEAHWRWTRGLATEKLRDLIRDDAIDILIDMAGHTGHNRLDALASRSAPFK